MTPPFPSSSPTVGRLTAAVLGFVVMVCLAMIVCTSYLKYQMDQAETVLAAPDVALGSDQEQLDRLRRDLGYGGFLGLAQKYALAHDASGFAVMKEQIKSADDIVTHLPDHISAETRHDLVAIVSAFDSAMQRVNAPASEAPEFTVSDLAPLYAAIPILNARIDEATAQTRLTAQNKMQFWGMLLTLVSWCSLVLAAACAAGIYLAIRDKHAAPMRALAQSIQNMTRGDMRTAIWGVERQDMIGELARAVDIARYHFSHLPDISVLSDQGPVRMRFEGEARSLFEAMMRAISRDSENIRDLASSLNESVSHQKTSVTRMTETVEGVLRTVAQTGENGDLQIKQAISNMLASAEGLKNAHAHATDQLNRMLPYIQERVQGMAEIAAITGKQVAQALQSLTVSEMGIKTNTERATEMLARMSSTADDLGERMFGAINLLQAGGKVLSETTDKLTGALSPQQSATSLSTLPAAAMLSAEALLPLTEGIDRVADQISSLALKLDRQPDANGDIASRTAAIDQMYAEQASIEKALVAIQAKIDQLAHETSQNITDTAQLAPALLSGVEHILAQRVETRLSNLENVTRQGGQYLSSAAGKLGDIEQALGAQKTDTVQNIAALADHTMALQRGIEIRLSGLENATRQGEHILSNAAGKLSDIELALGVQKADTVQHIAALTDRTSALQRGIETLAAQSSENQHLQTLVQHVAAVEQGIERNKKEIMAHTEQVSVHVIAQTTARDVETTSAIRHVLMDVADKVSAMTQALPSDMQDRLKDQWVQIAAQVEATRTDIEKLFVEQIGGKLQSFEQTLHQTQSAVMQSKHAIENPVPVTYALPPELTKQISDQWFQVTAQIEASRANLIETVTHQVELLESRIAETSPGGALTKSVSDYSAQKQIEQQTQILSELVSALSMLDAHVQQIQSQINGARAR